MSRYQSFAEFWPYYLREHAKPATRAFHYFGNSMMVIIVLAAIVLGHWLLLLAVPIAGYLFAWIGHFGVEKNRPATFKYPLWSLYADFKMWWCWLTGRIDGELEKAGVQP